MNVLASPWQGQTNHDATSRRLAHGALIIAIDFRMIREVCILRRHFSP